MLYPWQNEKWQSLWALKKSQRLPHALLLTGIQGVGKLQFAEHLARALQCQQISEDGKPCNNCHMCKLIEGRAHPNVLWIEPEKTGQAIKIDQIREVIEFINQSALQGKYRVVILSPANAMNMSAANALLKTLEEPSAGAILLLITDQSARLPATILSRCQRILFPAPPRDEALTWLKTQLTEQVDATILLNIANGAPLAAIQLMQADIFSLRNELFKILFSLSQKQGNPLKLAANLQGAEPQLILNFATSWMNDLLRFHLSGNKDQIVNQDYQQQLTAAAGKIILSKQMKLADYIQQIRRQLSVGLNLNKQLLIETLLIRWLEYA